MSDLACLPHMRQTLVQKLEDEYNHAPLQQTHALHLIY